MPSSTSASTSASAETSVLPSLPARPGLSDARRRLFEAALRLFGDRGYHSVSVRDVTNELGLQAGALYAHVPSKQHLLFELVRLGLDEHRDRLSSAVLDAGRDPADQVRALVVAHVRTHLQFPALARVVNRELRSLTEEQQAELAHIRDETQRLFVDVVARGVSRGVFNPADIELAVVAIGSMGIRTAEWWDARTSPDADYIADTYATFAVNLLS